MGRREEEDKAVLSPDGDDTTNLSPDDSPWSDNAWSEDEDDDEASLSFEDSGKGSDTDSDGLEEEDDAAAEESDSSEDEVGPWNTVGDVPLEWYKDEEHIGYDISGRKIKKRDRDGKIERFLSSKDNDDDWRKLWDDYNGEEVKITKEEAKIISRLMKGKTPHANVDPYPIKAGPTVENVAQYNNPIECLDLYLTKITLNKYRGTNPEIKFARFFVQKASVLKVMRFALCIVRENEWFADQCSRLQLNEKASTEAQFHFGTSYEKLFGSYYMRLLYDFSAAKPFAEILDDKDSEEAEF